MMNTKQITLSFLILVNYAFAQPGYVKIDKNLNDYSDSEIVKYENQSYYRCTFVIDSTTSLERLKLLSSYKKLSLVINLPAIPKEFYNVELDDLSSLNVEFGANFLSLNEFSNLKLKKLQSLIIYFKSNIKDISGLQNLTSLEYLWIYKFKGKKLPDDFKNLSSLTTIELDLSEIEDIDVLNQIKNLKTIHLFNCNNLKRFPQFNLNNNIETLSLYTGSSFNNYDNLSALQNLKKLNISGGGMIKFPDNLNKDLKFINLSNLRLLNDVSELGKYQNLISVHITKTGLKKFAGNFSTLLKLSDFTITDNDSLSSIEGFSSIVSLDKMEIAVLPSLSKIDFDISKCNFKIIVLSGLNSLQNIDGICSSTTLQSLVINGTSLKCLPTDFYKLEKLKSITFGRNNELIDISNLRNMKSLEQITFNECNKLKEIPPSFSSNLSLTAIELKFMKELIKMKGISNLPSLKSLYICAINKGFSLPVDLEKSNKLETIMIESNVNDISMIKNLKNLKQLLISHSLFSIPTSIYSNENLEIFKLYQSYVTDLSSLIKFKKLKEIQLWHNPNLVKIPDLTKFEFLKEVGIVSNKKLKISKRFQNKDNWEIRENGI